MILNLWPKMMSYGGGGGGGGGGSGGGGGGASGGGGGYGGAGGGAGAGGGSGGAAGGSGEQAPLEPTPVGAFRFNPITAKLQYWDGNQFVNITTTSPEVETGGTRGLFMGGGYPNCTNLVEFIQVNTTGDAADFGDLTAPTNRLVNAGFGSRTRGFAAGGGAPSPNAPTNVIQQHEFASKGDFNDFGDLSSARNEMSNVSDATRGVMAMGYGPSPTNGLEYITMASEGNSKDFGDMTVATTGRGTMQSPTRGVLSAGETQASPYVVNNIIDYLTFSTQGNMADFGDAVTAVRYPAAASNAVRGVQCLGGSPNTYTNKIEFITIATLGNARDFGDLTLSNKGTGSGACSSPTRAVFSVGSETNMDYVQIMSTGNGIDFGDKTDTGSGGGGASNGHGGLG